MSTTKEQECLRLVEEAVYWVRVMRTRQDDAMEEAFADWVRTSPEHLGTFLKQAALSDLLAPTAGKRGRG